ncbi:hypothetical protein KJ359_009114 [Pestalotiopsis sp. 9143b]|nr:hypothetical protein KJ359_009114 [Pestalotiopsis sp. 9143b]
MSSNPPTPDPGALPLRSALRAEDDHERTPPLKAVQIEEPEQEASEESHHRKQFSAGVGKRLSGRPPIVGANSSRTSLLSQSSLEPLASLASNQSSTPGQAEPDASSGHRHHHHVSHRFVSQVAEWLEYERQKKTNRKSRRSRYGRSSKHAPVEDEAAAEPSGSTDAAAHVESTPKHNRSYSIDSQHSDVSLDRLQRILDDSMSALGLNSIPQYIPRSHSKKSHKKRSLFHLHRAASSDTEFHDGDVVVPSCDAWLDNSKTMSYGGGKAADDGGSISSRKEAKERKAWIKFKNEIIRIAHTLRIKGWRRVPLDSGDMIEVQRLSGALTNAVYVVSPPKDIAEKTEPGKKVPAKLLLRVYGPQVENIIDRESELSVLRRLARKKIGPRMLGTFENGRFEQFFNAITLTAAHIRDPETSKQIAKRMRELHDGIEVLDEEREAGPGTFKAWDHWIDNVEKVITYLDEKILSGNPGPIRSPADSWKNRGLVLGVEWPKFKETYMKYRERVEAYYGGSQGVNDQLVFAHSDTQYGNILRIQLDDQKSPLLQPQNEHKQLIVIDFEYAAANTRGLEFANHFTEWTYNYHDPVKPYACNTAAYPTPEEQIRFLKAYVDHRPEFPHPGSTPNLRPLDSPSEIPGVSGFTSHMAGSTSSITDFMLDARAPPGGWKENEKRQSEQTEKQIKQLMEETRLWRVASTAFWVAWGLMQTSVENLQKSDMPDSPQAEGGAPPSPVEASGESDEFDYLAYTQDRALFFWGDCIQMGLAKLEDFPEDMQAKIKFVEY